MWQINHCEATAIAPIQRHLDNHPGSKAQLSWKGLAFALMLIAMQKKPMMLTEAWDTMEHIPEPLATELGIRRDGHLVSYRQVQHLFDRVQAVIKESFSKGLDGEDDAAFAGQIVHAIVTASRHDSVRPTKHKALDSTDHETYAAVRFEVTSKGPKPVYKDPDAGGGHLAAKNGKSSGVFTGRDVHLLVDIPDVGGAEVPSLVAAAAISKAGEQRGDATLPTIRRLHAETPIAQINSDRGYSMLSPKNWAFPLRSLGIDQAIDLSKPQQEHLNRTDIETGLLVIDGWAFSPSMPEHLRKLPRYGIGMPADGKGALAARYDQRKPYAVRLHGRDSEGYMRLKLPCAAGAVRCPLRPSSLQLRPSRVDTVQPPKTAGACCGQSTLTVPPDFFNGLDQPNQFGTTDWLKDYYRRVHVESVNSLFHVHYSRFARISIRIRKGIATALLIAFTIAAVNIQIVISFAQRTGAVDPFDVDDGIFETTAAITKAKRASRRQRTLQRLTS